MTSLKRTLFSTTVALSCILSAPYTLASEQIMVSLVNNSPFKIERICSNNMISSSDTCNIISPATTADVTVTVALGKKRDLLLVRMIDQNQQASFSSIAVDLQPKKCYQVEINSDGELVVNNILSN